MPRYMCIWWVALLRLSGVLLHLILSKDNSSLRDAVKSFLSLVFRFFFTTAFCTKIREYILRLCWFLISVLVVCRRGWLEDDCKETDSGAGYSGDLARTVSGRHCYVWNNLDSYVSDHLWKSHDDSLWPIRWSWKNTVQRLKLFWMIRICKWSAGPRKADDFMNAVHTKESVSGSLMTRTWWRKLCSHCTTTAAIQTTIVEVRGVSPTRAPTRWSTATSHAAVSVWTEFDRK